MNLFFRLAWLLITYRARPPIALGQAVTQCFRVLPTDLDTNGHMTNSRYLAMMDLSSLEMMARLGLLNIAVRKRWRPVVGGTLTSHRRALKPFQTYRVSSRVVYWDERWTYVEHCFERSGKIVARGLSKNVFIGRRGTVGVAEVLGALTGNAVPPPCLPQSVRLWREAEQRLTIIPPAALPANLTTPGGFAPRTS